MMTRREELQAMLETFLGSRNVYFQPPESIKLKFPCIVYSCSRVNARKADNTNYKLDTRYQATYITKNPEDPFVVKMLDLPYCSMDNTNTNDGLYHYNYTLFY